MHPDANLNCDIRPATVDERPIFRRLMELYQYDFTEFDGADIGPLGLYDYPYLDHYWVEDSRFPYLIRVDSQLAGFALVSRYNYLTGLKDRWVMSEFFILRKYRHRGVGECAARWVFDHHPSTWQVSQITENHAAITFWRKVIARYTGENFEEFFLENAHWHGPVQAFTSLQPAGETEPEVISS